MKDVKREDFLLYAITDQSWLGSERLYDQVKKALEGGITCLQLREKDCPKEEVIHTARELKPLCDRYHVPLIINDSVEIALECDADGVHLGQKDMQLSQARQLLGPDKIIGVSARTVEQARLAKEQGADYLGVGAVFPTSTKKDAVAITNKTIQDIRQAVDLPVVAIGGISEQNVKKLQGSGIDGIAVISAIFAKEDITEAARNLKQLVKEVIEKKE